MKVNVDVTVDMSDEQRVQLANVIDQKVSRRKATRVEARDYVWAQGKDWAEQLKNAFELLTSNEPEQPDADQLARDMDELI